MDGKYDKTIGEVCLDAIRREAYNEGFHDGARDGFAHGNIAICDAFEDACVVTKVVHNGLVTIVTFGDGGVEKVTYNPAYGYAYDVEKAVMAAMLKHLTGGRYIKALKDFESKGKALVFNSPAIAMARTQLVALGQALVEGVPTDVDSLESNVDNLEPDDASFDQLVSLGRALVECFANYDDDDDIGTKVSPNSASFEQLVALGRALVGSVFEDDDDYVSDIDDDFRNTFNDMDNDNVFDGT